MGEESRKIRLGKDKDLSETERAELELLRKDNAVLRMERDFANYVLPLHRPVHPAARRTRQVNSNRGTPDRHAVDLV
jgi:hypothetical protein